MKPGAIGLKFHSNGQITGFTTKKSKKQRYLKAAGINQHWKIAKINSRKLTKKLLLYEACGLKNYTMEFVYTGNKQSSVTYTININFKT